MDAPTRTAAHVPVQSAPTSPVMQLLGAHLPLTLLVDLALGSALRSEDVLAREASGRSALVA